MHADVVSLRSALANFSLVLESARENHSTTSSCEKYKQQNHVLVSSFIHLFGVRLGIGLLEENEQKSRPLEEGALPAST